MELPELPKPTFGLIDLDAMGEWRESDDGLPAFSESDMRAYAAAAVEAERERCAKLAEDERVAFGAGAAAFNDGCEAAARRIRATPSLHR